MTSPANELVQAIFRAHKAHVLGNALTVRVEMQVQRVWFALL